MRIHVRVNDSTRHTRDREAAGAVDTSALRAHVARRAGSSLARLADLVTSMVVRLRDVNGPRGGVDKHCLIEVRGPAFGVVVVEAAAASWTTAIDDAMARAGRASARAAARAPRPSAKGGKVWQGSARIT